MERSRRYVVITEGGAALSDADRRTFSGLLYDRMTEQVYTTPLSSFALPALAGRKVRTAPVMEKGKAGLRELSEEMGLGFDDWDLDFYTKLFRDDMGRELLRCRCKTLGSVA